MNSRRQFIKTTGKIGAAMGLLGMGGFEAWGEMGDAARAAGAGPASGIAGSGAGAGAGEAGEAGEAGGAPAGTLRFPRATPESQGVSSSAIRQFVAAANASGFSWHSFMLLRHGNVIAEGWWKPYEPELVHSLYSLSKSFTSTAIGLLVKEGKLNVHDKLVSFFPGDLPPAVSEHLGKITVRHLLTMNTGHGADTMPPMRASSSDWVKTYLAQPVEFEPGTHFLYNTGNTYMLGAIVHKITGETLEKFLAPRLFDPLGITGYDWEVSPQGLNTAGYGLRVKTEDIACLGQLYLQKGMWKGGQILTPEWVAEATSAQTTSQVNNGDWSEGYGYQFWRCTHGFYRGDGAFGQYCIVMPQYDAVMVVTGQTPDMQQSMNIIWDHIPGGMKEGAIASNRAKDDGAAAAGTVATGNVAAGTAAAGSETAGSEAAGSEAAALKKDLAALVLPVARGTVNAGMNKRYDGRKFSIAANELGIDSISFGLTDKGCVLRIDAKGKVATIKFGWEQWVSNAAREAYVFTVKDFVPMPTRLAGTATWTDAATLQLNVRFIEAIFGDRITCVFDGDVLRVGFLNSNSELAKKTDDPRKPLEGKRA